MTALADYQEPAWWADGEGGSMKKHATQESGAALVVAMLLLLVLAIMLIGFYFVAGGEQKVAASNRDNQITYYWAVAGLEQMSNLIADFFAYTAAPTPTSIVNWATASSNFKPYPVTISTSGLPLVTGSYTLYCTAPPPPGPCTTVPAFVLCSTVSGNSLGNCNGSIGGNGPLAGLEGVITPLLLQVTADGPSNTEVKLNRVVQEVAVPIFEFGIFSDMDLSFHAGADFNFGGRVHTNGNLYLAEDGGSTLNMNDHVSAAKGIIRDQLSNGYTMGTYPSTTCQYAGAYCAYVNVLTTAGGCPATLTGAQTGNCLTLQLDQGSVEQGPGSTENPNWNTLSLTTYNGFIQDGTTGAKVLNLAISLPGINSKPIAMILRPPAGESTTSALGMARFYNQASLRILLSDSQNDIMSIAGDTTEYPYPLAEAGSAAMTNMPHTVTRNSTIPSTYCPQNSNCTLPPIDACHPPLAESAGASTTSYMTAAGTTLLGGYIKIEMQLESNPGTWKDVTEEILAQGISRDIASGSAETMPAATLGGSSKTGNSLSSSTTYYYLVTALGAWGESAGTVVNGKPGSGNNTITVSWSAVTGATGYNVYRTTTSGSYTGSGNGVINLVVNTAQTGWASPWTSFVDGGGNNTASTTGPPTPCTNKSIIHLEEAAPGVTFPAWTSTAGWSNLANVSNPQSFVPINMYDSREGEVRDSSTATTPSLNGIMNLVEVDVGNLQQWFAGNIATSGQYAYNGPDALDNSGYILYTSDRRMNCMDGAYELEGTCTANAVSATTGLPSAGESGEFGNEDIINPANSNGAPNGVLDSPEDVDGDGVFRTYGAYAYPIAAPSNSVTPTGTTPSGVTWYNLIDSISSSTNNPAFVRITATQAQDNSVVIFRRALRLVNGTLGNLPPLSAANPSSGSACSGGTGGGFSVASENPIYILGDYNSSVANGFNDAFPLCHVPASVMGDAVTLLSNNWTPGAQSGYSSGDADSFANPAASSQRTATSTYYRMAVMAGKAIPFPQPSWSVTAGVNDTGTDGGVHNFLRYDENWSGQTLNYLGSLASFYFSRQATGIYKYGYQNTVYQPPTRNYTFDTDFQSISKLPPGTPRFTDVNALSYYQSTLPSQ
jgi:hypothetical protein